MSNSKYCHKFWLRASVLLIITLTLSIIFIPVTFADTPFTITSGSTGYYNIVLADNATEVEETAAEELQYWIEEATGVTLSIVAESGAQDKSFHVGPTAFAIANGINPDEEEEWIIKNVGNKIVINGYGTRGTLYGVFHLLEDEIGIRWFNSWEDYVPDLSSSLTIRNPIYETGKPSFAYRDYYDKCYETGANFTDVQPYSLHYVRNRLNGHFAFVPPEYGGSISYGFPYHVHTVAYYFPAHVYFDDHPEYFALVNGSRDREGQLCLSNSTVMSLMKSKVIASIEESYDYADSIGAPRPKFFSITPNDAQGFCECTSCTAQRNTYGNSGAWLNFVNEAADYVELTYPEVMIDTLAYPPYIDLPTGGVEPHNNVQIRFAYLSRDLLHDVDHANNNDLQTKLEGWGGISDTKIWWDYAANFNPNPPLATMFNYKNDLQYVLSEGFDGVFYEFEFPMVTDMHDCKAWMMAKLMEDVTLNESDLLNDFLDHYYGDADTYIRDYLDETRLDSEATNTIVGWNTQPQSYATYFDLTYVNWAYENFDYAEAAVSGDADRLRRVKECRASLDRLILVRWDALKAESVSTQTPMSFTRKEAATRYLETMATLKENRSLREQGDLNQTFNEKQLDKHVHEVTIPDELDYVPYRAIIDIPAEDFSLYTVNGGVALSSDYYPSQIGQAIIVDLDDFTNQTYADLHKPLIKSGLYNSTTGTRYFDSLDTSDLTIGNFKLYKLGTAPIETNDYFFLFRSWFLKVTDLDDIVAGLPGQEYDFYVSMKFSGEAFGGSSSDPDKAYIDRLILVEKGELPTELSSVTAEDITDFSTEDFRLATTYGGLYRQEDGAALTERSIHVNLKYFTTETAYGYHTPPVKIGLYNSTDGNRQLQSYSTNDLTLDQYKLYKVADDVEIKANDYLYLFRSWYVQVDLEEARTTVPNQKYDIYVSMKFEGIVYGGGSEDSNHVYIDRVVVVRQ